MPARSPAEVTGLSDTEILKTDALTLHIPSKRPEGKN
jgi:hypothetical protein